MRYIPSPMPADIQRRAIADKLSLDRAARRERFASDAMQQLIRKGIRPDRSPEYIARMAWKMADAMMAEQDKER